jgi:DNA-directed RNA polymerase
MMFPAIKRFKKRLSRAVEPVLRRKLPVMWVSPSGFPVLQDAFRLAENAIDVKVLKNRLRFSLRELQDQISEQGQRTGILPNFIHSLDAAHLVKTVNLARCKGVTDINTIHDSYATHACDMDILSQCIRDAFCEVYPSNENRLEQFERWCVALAGSTHDDGSSDSVGVVRTDAERALIGLARRWAPVDSEPVPPKGTVAKDKAPDTTEDWIDQVRQSEYFFT